MINVEYMYAKLGAHVSPRVYKFLHYTYSEKITFMYNSPEVQNNSSPIFLFILAFYVKLYVEVIVPRDADWTIQPTIIYQRLRTGPSDPIL